MSAGSTNAVAGGGGAKIVASGSVSAGTIALPFPAVCVMAHAQLKTGTRLEGSAIAFADGVASSFYTESSTAITTLGNMILNSDGTSLKFTNAEFLSNQYTYIALG